MESKTKSGIQKFITIYMDPGDRKMTIPWPKTVGQLLKKLELQEGTALVARDGKLLTPDRHIWPDDAIYIRIVISRG